MLKLGSNVSDQKWGQYKYKGKMSRCHISDPKSDIRSKYYYWHQDKIWYDECSLNFYYCVIWTNLLRMYRTTMNSESIIAKTSRIPDPTTNNSHDKSGNRDGEFWLKYVSSENLHLWHSVESNNTTKTKTSTKTSHTQPTTAGAATEMASYKA